MSIVESLSGLLSQAQPIEDTSSPTSPASVASLAATVPASGKTQPLAINLFANQPVQLPILDPSGITIVNNPPGQLTLGTEPTFTQNPVVLPSGAVLPWKTATTVWAVCPNNSTITVIPGVQNYYNPNVLTTTPSATAIASKTYSAVSNTTLNTGPLPVGTNTLTVVVSNAAASTNIPSIAVIGDNTGLGYFGVGPAASAQVFPPYLYQAIGVSASIAKWVIAVDPTVDASYTVVLSFAINNSGTLALYADPDIIQESDFYNGAQGVIATSSNTVVTNGTLITGPARLLNAFAVVPGSATPQNATVQDRSGNWICRANESTTSGSNQSTSVAFPENTILRAGQTLEYSITGAGNVGVTYTYP